MVRANGFLPLMMGQNSGKTLNILFPTAYWASNFLQYVASKAALIGMSRLLAREFGEFGICLIDIAPGLVLSGKLVLADLVSRLRFQSI